MNTRGSLQLATRGSALARRQAALVKAALEERRFEVDLVTVETTGDQIRDELIHRLGKTGAFVRELDERVLDGDLDAAVHSMKDVPTEQPSELVTAAVPERGPPGDVLVTPDGLPLEDLPAGAVVGTSSLRRRAQLLANRPDLEVEPLRGNVDTRIEKLLAPALQAEHEARTDAGDASNEGGYKPQYDDGDDEADDDAFDRTVDEWFDALGEIERQALGREVETEYDAIVLAEAGLERSGLDHHVDFVRLPTTEFVPAPGQGALAVAAVDGDLAREVQSAIDHPRSRVETTAERILLAELGGGCIAPLGIHAVVQGEYVNVRVQALSRDGDEQVAASRDLPLETYPEAAREFAGELADRGAADLIEQTKREAGATEGSTGDDGADGPGSQDGDADRPDSQDGDVGGPAIDPEDAPEGK